MLKNNSDTVLKDALSEQAILLPEWPAPGNIKSLLTTRHGGWSTAPFDSFNLAAHVDDDECNVKKNRQKLAEMLPSEPVWLNQIHSNIVVDAALDTAPDTALDTNNAGSIIDADGSFTTKSNAVSVVLTADCLPVLVCTRQGDGVAALHAGWRGLAQGILEQGIEQLLRAAKRQPEDLLVWFGPAIGAENFEVGEEVRQIFLQTAQNQEQTAQCFVPVKEKNNKWLADIYQLARLRLSLIGVENFSGGNYCTYRDKENFFSFRRDGKTGRMASLIWIESGERELRA